jgi:Fic-DOC domain mobile mystery protein B
VGLELVYSVGQTPLDDDERDGLLISTISTRNELDEFEQKNIEAAIQWTMTRSFGAEEVLTADFIRLLHRRMFGMVWSWAGSFRRSNKNIGVDKHLISVELRKLLDDCRYWMEHRSYGGDEVALRFKHRLVAIHCFANGNGRHSRLMADILIEKVIGLSLFTWGSRSHFRQGEARSAYLAALRDADRGRMQPLLEFARS